ncbi:hypothetical protein ACOME3_002362 [Neoechinorhynchus agilis]
MDSFGKYNPNAASSLLQPPALTERPADKFRVTLPVQGYTSSEISTSITADRKLKIHAKHVDKGDIEDDYSAKEFSKTFVIPANADTASLTSFITASHTLVVEIPLRASHEVETSSVSTSSSDKTIDIKRAEQNLTVAELVKSTFVPQIVGTGNQKVEMNVSLSNFKPEQIQLTLKDRDLILKAESHTSGQGRTAREYVYRQVTLPAGTDVDKLFSTFENGFLHIEAPFHEGRAIAN